MASYINFNYETKDQIAWVTLSREEKMNTMTPEFYGELKVALRKADEDNETGAIILTGSGAQAFCAGVDIESFRSLEDVNAIREYVRDSFEMFRAIEMSPKPVIAAVNGLALGGGCELIMACDIVIAAESAEFGLPETQVGLIPGFGVVRGKDIVSTHVIKYMALTGDMVSAQEALSVGLVNKVVPAEELLGEARRIAEKIISNAPLGVQLAKAVVNRNTDEGYAFALEATSLLHLSDDHKEGISAFKEKRAPRFKGR